MPTHVWTYPEKLMKIGPLRSKTIISLQEDH